MSKFLRINEHICNMFTKEERSTFAYWMAHWCAFQMTALNLRVWKFKYLFHDFEKPWLRLILPYSVVQKIHRFCHRHHYEHFFKFGRADFRAMMIDWECSRFTKEACSRNAVQELFYLCENVLDKNHPRYNKFVKRAALALTNLGLVGQNAYIGIINDLQTTKEELQ